MSKKIVYYEDALKDDFANNGLKGKAVNSDFPFVIKNPFWAILEFITYRIIATPLIFLIAKIGFGLKIKNRKALRGLKGTGYYIYGNHTQSMMDAYTPSLITFPKHTHIITGPEAVSVPVLKTAVQLLGGIPLPGTPSGFRPFLEALRFRTSRKRVIAIYPEAHIWPWYTGIRPFPDGSFAYPVKENLPVVAYVTTYRQRKVFKNLPPLITVTLSDPFYCDTSLSPREAKKELRDKVYEFMCKTADNPENYAYIEYKSKCDIKN